jgi:ribonuclease HI
MVGPSKIARKARRAHEQQQEKLRKQNLPSCEGCDLCSATKAREIDNVMRESLRSKIRQDLKDKLFKGDVVIAPRHVARAEAANEVDFGAEQDRSVYWTDASRLRNSRCGIGVAYCSSTETWVKLSWHVRGPLKTHVLEVYAISKALEIAWERCRNVEAEKRPSSVRIYSDCPAALEYFSQLGKTLVELKRFPHGEELVGPGIIAATQLSDLQITVELRYVPGHAGILGNIKADRAANTGAKRSVGKQELGRWMTAIEPGKLHGI